MKSKLLKMMLILGVTIVIFAVPQIADATPEWNYTYSVSYGKAIITDFSTNVSGDITIPDTIGGYPVIAIGEYAFENCSNLTSITFPESVTQIAPCAFYGCTGLKSINIPDGLEIIDEWVFFDCSSLTNIEIPDSVTSIGPNAFSNCIGLASIEIPGSVRDIAHDAFYGCTGLISVVIHDGVEIIDQCAFYDCIKLTNISIPDSVMSICSYAFHNTGYYNDKSNWINGILYISNHIVDSEKSINGDCVVRNGTRSIGATAFYNCTELTGVELPDSVKSIDSHAFYNCSNLININIPDSVINIGEEAFYNTGYYNNKLNWMDGILYISNHIIKAEISIAGDYIIREGTKSICQRAFYKCTGLTSIEIPEGVIKIDDWAFNGCSGLTNIKIPGSVISIESSAFAGCTGLTDIELTDGVNNIGFNAFSGCSGLTNIKIPDSVTSIESSASKDCIMLTNLEIPDSVTNIGYQAFDNTGYYNDKANWVDGILYISNHLISAEKSISEYYKIREGTKSIAEGAFENCTGLFNVEIAHGIQCIGFATFRGCTGLTSISIPDSVVEIASYAFYNCVNLSDVKYGGNENSWDNIKIGNIKNDPILLAKKTYDYVSCNVFLEIIDAQSDGNSLKFVSKLYMSENIKIDKFGTVFIPLGLFKTGDVNFATVSYDNSKYNILNGQTFGTTLKNIPDFCSSMNIVGKSFVKTENGDYIWSEVKYASIDDTILKKIEQTGD